MRGIYEEYACSNVKNILKSILRNTAAVNKESLPVRVWDRLKNIT